MIKIEVDEAHAFDMLAILEVKASHTKDWREADKLFDYLNETLGKTLSLRIRLSKYYKELLLANKKVFNYIEELNNNKYSEVTGLEVHKANMERYKWKRELQQHFFQSPLTEQKTKF